MTQSYPRFPRAFMSTSREELSNISLTIKGPDGTDGASVTLPEDLQGHVFINSFAGTVASPPPAAKDRPEGAIPEATVMPAASGQAALFDGDGMVYRLDFHQAPGAESAKGNAWLSSKLIKPPAFFADEITHGKEEYQDFQFHDLGMARVSLLGSASQLNTAFVKVNFSETHPPRLLATNDAARPFEIDPCSLKIVAPVGNLHRPDSKTEPPAEAVWSALKVFPGVFELLMSSAHPCTAFSSESGEEKMELFTVSDAKTPLHLLLHRHPDSAKSKTDKLSLIRWSISSADGEKFEQWEVVHKGQPIQILQSTHMLGITQNYVLVVDTAMKFEQIETVFLIVIEVLNAVLVMLKSTGEERAKEIKNLEEGFTLILKLIRIDALNFGKSIWKAMVIALKSLVAAFQKLPKHHGLSLLKDFASALVTFPHHFHSSSQKTHLGADILETLGELHQDLEDVRHRSLQDAIADFVALRPQAENEAPHTGILNHFLESIEHHVEFMALNIFLKGCDWLQDSPVSVDKGIVDDLIRLLKLEVEPLRLKIASRQNLNTPVYVIKRSDLETPEAIAKQQVEAQRVEVEGAFAHLFTDYSETESGEIVIVAPMTDALDPAEYVDRYDHPKLLKNADIQSLIGMIPMGLDANELALIRINPHLDHSSQVTPSRLSFDKVKNTPEYRDRQIYPNLRRDPLFIGLYAFRDDNPKLTDVYVMQGGAFPELLTDFVYRLYENYSPHRQIPLDQLLSGVQMGVPMVLTHVKVDRTDPENDLKVVQTYEFAEGEVIFSLQFVPRAGSDPSEGDEGYLVCTVVHSDHLYSSTSPDADWSDNCEIRIFDAKRLSEGPQYRLSHPRLNFGLTLHSTWLNELAPAPAKDYSFAQDYGPWVTQFIDNYLETNRYPKHNREILTGLFDKIGQAFDQYRQQTEVMPSSNP